MCHLSTVQEEDAAKARDRVAIVMGLRNGMRLNFNLDTYAHELEELNSLSTDVAIELCRQSSGHISKQSNAGYRGVYARPGKRGICLRWEAKIR